MENTGDDNGRGSDLPLHLLALVVESWTVSITVFTRSQFGRDYLGIQAAAVLLLIPLYCCVCTPAEIPSMMVFLVSYIGMLIVHRLAGFWRRFRRELPGHSRYRGWPVLARFFPRWSERTIKRYVEPLFVLIVAFCLAPLSPALWLYLSLGAVFLFALTDMNDTWVRTRATHMHNSVLEQQEIAERFREMRGDL